MNQSYSDLDSITQLSKECNTLGFDLSTGQTWIYPTNYEIRDYQFNITKAALHNNTLVSLPTGLGKTFIAAVVMYNFYRWYPIGKIIFMAPTKPLVKQQQDACYNIMGIPPEATVELTGSKNKESRLQIWKEKRVFFITPHILQNDIDVILDLAQQIKCIVIDEAHKALGKNANCEAIKKIHKINKYFRVLALSATPGSSFNSVKDVVTNLLISHIEGRSNESIDVAPYVFKRKLETFVIPITGKLLDVKTKYILILDKYIRPLLQYNIITGNCANLSKGRIVLTMKEFNLKGRSHPKYGFIVKTLNLCVTLYHGFELLIRHGLRGFLVFFDGTISKPLINSIQELHGVLDDVRNYLGPQKDIEMLPDGTIPEVEGPIIYSHPKFQKLSEVLIDHFKLIEDGDTRVMVFCEYRESVMEIYQMLLRQRPLIKPRVFLGQGAISQAQQLQAVKQFRSGTCNTLISTCIGEEGLDVGEVDLIVCFDISSKSPIRIVQRMGRTGRKRDGRVVILVTEGKEQQLLSDCLVQKNNMTALLESQSLKECLYTNNPKMIPDDIKPECKKIYITVQEIEKPKKKEDIKKKKKTKKSNILKNMFDNISSQSSSKDFEEDFVLKNNKITKSPVKAVRGSKKNHIPSTNQMDLRSMFSKINNTQSLINLSLVCSQETNYTKIEDCPELNIIASKIKNYMSINTINKHSCKICKIFGNKILCSTMNTNNKMSTKWIKPNMSVLNSITSESLTTFLFDLKSQKILSNNSTKIFNNSLEYFNLESTCDIFSDDSTEAQIIYEHDPIIFNHSVGIFESSKIYYTPLKTDTPVNTNLNIKNKQDILEENYNSNNLIEVTDNFKDKEVLLVNSVNECTSPILHSQRFSKNKQRIQRKLFSQSQVTACLNTDINSKHNSKQELKNTSTVITKTDNSTPICNIVKTPDPNVLSIKNTNMSTPKFTSEQKSECNINFWDDSLFEMYDSDESLFEEEIKQCSNVNTLPQNQNMNINKNLNSHTENKEIHNDNTENKEDIYNDSDTTIMLSFNSDKIFENIEKEKTHHLTKDDTTNNKSLINKTKDSSLLSVTQAIDLLNDSKFKSLNNSIQKDDKNNLSSCNSVLKNNLFKMETSKESSNENMNGNSINVGAKNEEFDDLEISEIFKDFDDESEEEFSLLSFSQKRKRKLQEDQNNTDNIKNVSISNQNIVVLSSNSKNIKSPYEKIIPAENKQNISNVLKDKNEIDDFEDSSNTMRNKKFKLSTMKINKSNSSLKLQSKQIVNNIPILLSDSDDDFEVRPKIKPLSKLTTPVKKIDNIPSHSKHNTCVTKKVQDKISETNKQSWAYRKSKAVAKKQKACAFIDDEAEVEEDEHYVTDSNSDCDDDELLESSFVSYTQNICDKTDMKAKYLQSVRSPKFNYGAFKLPHRPPPQVYSNVFSQVENCENETYVNDSFCVGNDETLSQRESKSYLELIEEQLEKQKKRSKKRKRIITISDSD